MPRRKRAVESDDEYQTAQSPQTPKGSIQAAFARAKPKRARENLSPSPSKPAQTTLPVRKSLAQAKKPTSRNGSVSGSPAGKNVNSKKIYSFFNNATQRQHSRPSASPEKNSTGSLVIDDDLIVDSSDEDKKPARSRPSTVVSGTKQKNDVVENDGNGIPALRSSQKFLKPNSTQSSFSSQPNSTRQRLPPIEQRPWTDQYGPVDMDELAVHKKKVQDVRDWLARTVAGKERKRLLVLKGGAGGGKTTTLRVVCQTLGIGVTEWRNPDAVGKGGIGASLASQFEEFVARTSIFGSLTFQGQDDRAKKEEKDSENHVVLVEEFPNTYSQSSTTIQSFRKAVLQYLTMATPSADDFFGQQNTPAPIVPIVMIISESLLTTSTASSDSFTAHRLLGTEVLGHPGTSLIEFNPIAPTFMSKALDLVLKKEARRSGRRFAPGPAVLRHLSDIGDVRSAISALEFFCLHQGGELDWSGKIQFTKGKGKKAIGEAALTTMEKESLQMITQRENTLGIFHAVGKVVYNKREKAAATDRPPPQPPPWLPQHHRTKVSEVDVDNLLNELGTDIHVFIAALHENYVLSCAGLTEEDTLDSVNGCLDSLSDADLLCPDRFALNQSRYSFQGTTTDALRQDEISFDTSVRGMLFNLPHPVRRAQPPPEYVAGRGKTGRGTTAFQMLYPTSLRLWRKKDQIEEIVELFNEKFRKGQLDEEIRPRNRQQQTLGGVATWRKNAQFPGSLGPKDTGKQEEEPEESASLIRGASKSEQLLERLPYLYFIERRKPMSSRSSLSRQVDKVVSFSGLGTIFANEENELEEGETANAEEWSTDKPVEEETPRKRSLGMEKNADGHVVVPKDMEKLVLSDDDIEDD